MNRYVILLIVSFALFVSQGNASERPWILVDTENQSLTVMEGSKVREVIPGISLGRSGAADLHLQGDGSTPKGIFRIAWVNQKSKFHLFFGLDYPRVEHAERAFNLAKIGFETYSRILDAVTNGKTPPQNTELGGYIGIHGLGKKSLEIHNTLNWTEGCVALTNAQIELLAKWVEIGTKVVII